MQTLAKVLAVVAVMAFVVPAFGAEGDKPKGKGERPSVYGVLKAVGESSVTIAMTLTSSHEVPEKLPFDQLCRFTMLASSAKVIMKSVMAEQM